MFRGQWGGYQMTIQEAINDLKNIQPSVGGKSLKMAISSLEKQLNNGWIPCKNRQPANEESVKYKSDFIIQDKRYELPYVATWNKGKKLWQDEEGKQIDTVVAWQPLPEPYKAD